MYWAMASIDGRLRRQSRERAERFVAFVAMIAGTAYYSYVIGSVSAIVNQTDTVRRTISRKWIACFPT